MVSSLAKKKLAKIFTKANAITPYPNKFKALDVISTSFWVNEPYPNNPFTISSEAIIKPRLAGIENSNDNSKDLFWIFEIFEKFFDWNALERIGSETVPTRWDKTPVEHDVRLDDEVYRQHHPYRYKHQLTWNNQQKCNKCI